MTINLLLSYLCTKGQVLAGSVSQASSLCLKVATTKEENNYPPVRSLIIQHITQWSDTYLTIIPPLDICSHRPLSPSVWRVKSDTSEMLQYHRALSLLALIHRIIP